jgi:hypothetical protein
MASAPLVLFFCQFRRTGKGDLINWSLCRQCSADIMDFPTLAESIPVSLLVRHLHGNVIQKTSCTTKTPNFFGKICSVEVPSLYFHSPGEIIAHVAQSGDF